MPIVSSTGLVVKPVQSTPTQGSLISSIMYSRNNSDDKYDYERTDEDANDIDFMASDYVFSHEEDEE